MGDGLARRGVKAVDRHDGLLLIELVELARVTRQRQALALMHVAVQGDGALAAGRDRVDGELRAGDHVAAGKDIGLRGLIRHTVGLDGAVAVEDHSLRRDAAKIDALADGADDGRDLDGLELAGADRLAAALRVGLAQLHDLDLEGLDLAVFADDLGRSAQEAELHALFHGFRDFLRVCRHLGLAAAVDDVSILRAKTDGRAADVHGDIAAADDGALFADARLLAEVDLAQEVHAAVHAGEVLAGHADGCALLRADGKIEALVALLAQLVDGEILADLDAALEVDAHLLEHLDLGVDDVLLEAEARDAEGQHAAGHLVFIKHGDVFVAHVRQIVGARQAGRAGADDGDLLRVGIGDAAVGNDLRDVALVGLELLLGDELLDLVDGDGAVDIAAGAGFLAAAVADAAADSRERVILLDELERIQIAALRGQIDVALHGDVRRAGGLAGGGAGLVALLLVVVLIVRAPHVLAPVVVVRQRLLRIRHRAGLGAQLLAELGGAGRADLGALAAGDALLGIDMGAVSGGGHIGRVEQLARSQREAGAERAVADGKDLILAVDVRDLVDIAVVLGALEDLHRLFIGDAAALAGLKAVVGKLADGNAQLVLQLAAALALNAHGIAAGAIADAEVALILFQPVGDVLHVDRLVRGRDGLLDRDDVHADTGASGRHHAGDLRQRQKRHALEKPRDLRVLFHLLKVHVHQLGRAGHEDRQRPLLVVVGVLPVVLEQADHGHLVKELLDVDRVLARLFAHLRRCGRDTHVHRERELRHLVGDDAGQAVILGRILVELRHAELDIHAVRDLFAQLQDQFSCHVSGSFLPLKMFCFHSLVCE